MSDYPDYPHCLNCPDCPDRPDFEALYFKLFRRLSAVTNELAAIQQEMEEEYLRQGDHTPPLAPSADRPKR
ncbi:MAG: hypothetical protein GXY32_11595 [Ruminococcaceae bacterium]|nr:hypothetical protein [Oscillospiraceae bacterium]